MQDIQDYEAILDGRRELEVEIVPGKPKLRVSYDSLRLTDEVLDRLDTEIPKDAPDRKVVIAMLVEVGLDWKLGRKGEKIPTDKEGLRTVSSRALQLIWNAILDDARGKAEDTTTSEKASAAT
ncbi:MAG: hypothetical protein ACO1SV_21505 [Fimbriimonas sp.]